MLGDNMLEKFSVKNYKKFKDEVELDFTNVHDYKFNNYCINDGIITKAIMFGNNASGKSSFGYALFDIVSLLTDKHVSNEQKVFCKNLDSKSNNIEFKYSFRFSDCKVKYNYSKNQNNVLVYEELWIDDTKIFSYDFISKKKNVEGLNIIDADNLNFDYYEGNIAVLRYIANNTTQKENSTIKQMIEFISGMLWFRSLRDNSFIGLDVNVTDFSNWIIENKKVKELEKFLRDMANIDIKLAVLELPGDRVLVEKHNNGLLPFTQVASSGTLALTLLFYWVQNLQKASFVFIDEFDAFYQYKLSRTVIELFLNYPNLQVIFTSHNTYIASNELLRPDCYFKLKDGKIRSFADITSRELREAHNIEKMMRQGEFDD